MKNVHFASILEDDFVIKVEQCLDSRVGGLELNKGLPDFGLFEYEYFDDFAVGYKKLIEVVMSDDIAEPVVDTDEEHRPLFGLLELHLGYNNYIKNYIKLHAISIIGSAYYAPGGTVNNIINQPSNLTKPAIVHFWLKKDPKTLNSSTPITNINICMK